MNNEKILDISWGAILKIAVAAFCFYLIYLVRDILIWFVFALIISVLFNPAINFLQRRRFSRVLSTLFIYVAVFGVLGLFIYWIIPIFVSEIQQFTNLFPQYFEKVAPPLKDLGVEAFASMETFITAFQEWLIKASSSIFNALASIFGGIFSFITIFTIAIFLSMEEKGMERAIRLFSPKKHEAYVLDLFEKSQTKVAGWFGTRVICCIFVGLATFLACFLFNIKYAATFGLLSGILNIIPIVGPVISGIIIIFFSALDSWLKSLFIIIILILIQQIEGNILSPILTKKFIGLPPALMLISLMLGASLWGILGAIVAIPLAGIIYEFLRDFLKQRKEEQAEIL